MAESDISLKFLSLVSLLATEVNYLTTFHLPILLV